MKFSSLLKKGVPLPPGACDRVIEGGLAEERASGSKMKKQEGDRSEEEEDDDDDDDEDEDNEEDEEDEDEEEGEEGEEGKGGEQPDHYGKSSSDSRYAFLSLTRKKGASKSRHIYHGRNEKEIMVRPFFFVG